MIIPTTASSIIAKGTSARLTPFDRSGFGMTAAVLNQQGASLNTFDSITLFPVCTMD